MQKAVPDLKKKCFLSDDIYDYHYVSQGKTTVPSIDDNEDLEFTHDAFDILHFSEEETYNIYKIVSCVMHMGELVILYCNYFFIFFENFYFYTICSVTLLILMPSIYFTEIQAEGKRRAV